MIYPVAKIRITINSKEVIRATPFRFRIGVEEAAAQPGGSLTLLYKLRFALARETIRIGKFIK